MRALARVPSSVLVFPVQYHRSQFLLLFVPGDVEINGHAHCVGSVLCVRHTADVGQQAGHKGVPRPQHTSLAPEWIDGFAPAFSDDVSTKRVRG